MLPVSGEISALATASLAAAVLAVLIGYETVRYAEDRERLRHGDQIVPSDPSR